MLACPICKENNPPEAKICRRCGNVFRSTESPRGRRHPLLYLLGAGALVAIPLFFVAISTETGRNLTYFGTKIRDQGPDFRGLDIPMKRVDVRVSQGWLELPLKEIEQGKLVEFYYQGPAMNVPLIAYVGPTGRLITAFAWCDPCKSSGYHFESNTLVCDKCKTTWALEGDGEHPQARPAHYGFAGNCRLFGPEFVEHQLVDGMVRIPEARLRAWSPRQGATHS